MPEIGREKFVRPEVLQVALLDEIAERLLEIRRLYEKPRGYVYPINITLTETRVLDFVSNFPYTPLFSVTIINDGPDEVYPSIAIGQVETPLKPGETITFDVQSPRIEKLYLIVNEGKTARIRGFGVY